LATLPEPLFIFKRVFYPTPGTLNVHWTIEPTGASALWESNMAGNHSMRRRLGSAERFWVLAAVLAVLIAGCATRVTQTKRSGTEQELLGAISRVGPCPPRP